MLKCDGLERSQFMPLWRDAMWHAVDPAERARLVLELGRLTVRDEGRATPILIAYSSDRDPPLSVMALRDLPSAEEQPALRATVKERLAEGGASEVYVLVALEAGDQEGRPRYVLSSWGETLDGEEVLWMQAYRWRAKGIEEAPSMRVPDPSATEIGKRLAGLLTPRH